MKVLLHTFGCKVNQYETQIMRSAVEAAGFETSEYGPYEGEGEVCAVIVNSCTVTGESDRKLRSFLRRVRREHPEAALVLTGCMPQAFPDSADALDADVILGNAARRNVITHLQSFLIMRRRIIEIPLHGDKLEQAAIDSFEERTRAFVKIEDGCNRFCSYCIIPYARGRVRSKPLAALAEEISVLAANGYREIVLVGINLTAYGMDTGEDLCSAVETVCAAEGISRVRLGSLEPDMITSDMIKRLSGQQKLCPQFHLSLQSGCDDTLKRMNRRYTTEEYSRICTMLREAFPDCALTTDVMVGFPGEDDNEFESSLEFVRKTGFARTHVFAYSPRPGTPAAAETQVAGNVKAARSRRMIEECDLLRDTWLETQIGRTVSVLAEKCDEKTVEGYTPQYIQVSAKLFEGNAEPGDILQVRLDSCKKGIMYGCVLPK